MEENNQNVTPPFSETPNTTPPVILNSTEDPNPIDPKPSKKFSLKLIIGIIIFLLLAGGATAGYVSRDKLVSLVSKPTPTPTVSISPTPTPDLAADWKTHKEDRFSFKYPHLYSISNENMIVSLMSPLNPTPRKGSELLIDEVKLEILAPILTVKGLSEIISEAKQTRNERSNEPLNFEEQNLKIDGIDARKLKTQYSVVYYVIVSNYLYKIIQYPPITSRQSELDQILSTFKFTQ